MRGVENGPHIKDRARQFLLTEQVQLTQPELERVEGRLTVTAASATSYTAPGDVIKAYIM